MRSLRIGLRLYAMALEPIWLFSKGSSTSLRCWSRRMSLENLCALCAMELSTLSTRKSYLREYVCVDTG